jgi:L-asparagine transporter-like permease
MIFSLARTGWAPASLGRLNHEGSPQNAVLHSSFGIRFALVLILFAPKNAFRYMLGAAFTGLILSWLVSLLSHISFRRRRSREELAALPLRFRWERGVR